MHMYIYIYVYICVYIYMYTYVYLPHLCKNGESLGQSAEKVIFHYPVIYCL
jgi:hypothetical protein